MSKIDSTSPSNKFCTLTRDPTRVQTSLITQLRTGHILLNKHLYCIKKSSSLTCSSCQQSEESVHHFLYECRAYCHARVKMLRKLGHKASSTRHLLSTEGGIQEVLKYAAETERLRSIFGDVPQPLLLDTLLRTSFADQYQSQQE